jgi:RimJ/RimL family protein N-acetyltransferase
MIEVHRHADARAFLARAESWLEAAEIEHAVLLANARHARADDSHYEKPVYWATIESDGELLGCAYRTPPYFVGVTALPPEAIAPLVTSLEQTYRSVSGFQGIEPTVSTLAEAWRARHGGAPAVVSRQRLLLLPREPESAPAPGMLRAAVPSDAAVAHAWGTASAIETGIEQLDGTFCARLAAARQLYFWVDGSQQRSMIGVLRQTQRAAAIGILYTPPAYRGRRYARTALAALAAQLRERGIAQTYLYVDPASSAAPRLADALGCTFVQDAVDIALR